MKSMGAPPTISSHSWKGGGKKEEEEEEKGKEEEEEREDEPPNLQLLDPPLGIIERAMQS